MTIEEHEYGRPYDPTPQNGDVRNCATDPSVSGRRGDDASEGDIPAIVRDYLAGITVPDLARRHRHTNRTISRVLREAEVLGTLQRRCGLARRGRPSPAHLAVSGLACGSEAPAWPYIAGFFDGEGSIVQREIAALGGSHRRYRVTIVQKQRAPLAWMHQLLGVGTISFANGTHRYQVAGQRAVFAFLVAVLPYLIVKREAAEMALAALQSAYGWDADVAHKRDDRHDDRQQGHQQYDEQMMHRS